MKNQIIEKAAAQFGNSNFEISSLGEGLIHRTYKVVYADNSAIVLQCINQNIFAQPENIIHNYRLIAQYLNGPGSELLKIPSLLQTHTGRFYWVDIDGNFWRATEYISDTYSLMVAGNETQAKEAAKSFGNFTRALSGMDAEELNIIIPGFHDLSLRYKQFETAVSGGNIKRLLKATHVIAELRQRHRLVDFYEMIQQSPAFKKRIMHHDSKINNILFDKKTHLPVCPVDLDTTMPGDYFSDLGDPIRSSTCTVSENDTQWEAIGVNEKLYHAVVEGYLLGIGSNITPEELKHVHHAGLMVTYMQALRFVSDYLNHDIYYQISYPEQNLNRALNQLVFLEKLEEFLAERYQYSY